MALIICREEVHNQQIGVTFGVSGSLAPHDISFEDDLSSPF